MARKNPEEIAAAALMQEAAAVKATALTPKGRYLAVQNLTSDIQIITPDDPERQGQEIILQPWETVGVRKHTAWADDRNLSLAVARGWVATQYTDALPRALPKQPTCPLVDPHDLAVLREIVFGTSERARELIVVQPVKESGQTAPDFSYIKTTHRVVLQTAREWLLKWGPPAEFAWRVDAIDQRLDEIQLLP